MACDKSSLGGISPAKQKKTSRRGETREGPAIERAPRSALKGKALVSLVNPPPLIRRRPRVRPLIGGARAMTTRLVLWRQGAVAPGCAHVCNPGSAGNTVRASVPVAPSGIGSCAAIDLEGLCDAARILGERDEGRNPWGYTRAAVSDGVMASDLTPDASTTLRTFQAPKFAEWLRRTKLRR
ncbi:hypothetical protein POSPLADRAFT_1147085 [Postia placenta MAD-698-R-SB12]|uniref:Uncharacterized protein n=1 Tax=Postia placenta MAD-698-R-SB12 TaxID=670580 RepID=A0A1X6MYM9_9APHY|nr:hypothetical protein POSPLADRAFT_1147085 [Postia placenta MAD-698-R-SB12]OSX61326.1 hypothetical protein POSPLADRAFT_1147085 [Postia placenta MAD-698-R-SB12]